MERALTRSAADGIRVDATSDHAEQRPAYRDGTTHVILEPLDFLAPLASIVPLPRLHLTR
jgi:hypothetical protein